MSRINGSKNKKINENQKKFLIEKIKMRAPNINVDFLIHSKKSKLIEILNDIDLGKDPDVVLKKGYKSINDGKYDVTNNNHTFEQKLFFKALIEELLKDINAGIPIHQLVRLKYDEDNNIIGYSYDAVEFETGMEIKKCIFKLMNLIYPDRPYAANVIHAIRLILGISGSEFARRLNISRQAYDQLEKGKSRYPKTTIKKICDLLTYFEEGDFL